jgi:uracil-xanthine permease
MAVRRTVIGGLGNMKKAAEPANPYSKALDGVIQPDEAPPLPQNIVLGVQHVFAMFGATVLGPLLMGFDPNTAILFSGVATLVFYVVVGGKVPSYLGSSFAFIAAVTAATGYSGSGANPQIQLALGGILVAGVIYALVGVIVQITGTKVVNWLFPPTVTGAIVGIIGLSLARVGVQQLGSDPVGAAIGLSTVTVVAVAAVYTRGFLRRIPILIGAVFGYGSYFLVANLMGRLKPIDFSAVLASPWIGLPTFKTPVFDITAISLIAPVAIILVAENLGHVKAIGGMTRRDLDPYLGRAFIGDGLATIISAAGGGTGVTTYAENMGVMRLTRNFSSLTMVVAAIIAIMLGLSPKFGELIKTIPLPVLGGLSFVMFGIITATAGSIWQQGRDAGRVDFDDMRTLIVVGVALVMGAGDLTITVGKMALGGIVTATLAAVFLYHITRFLPQQLVKGEEQGSSPYNS